MNKLAVLLLFTASAGLCSDDEPVNRLFQLKYAEPGRVAAVLSVYSLKGNSIWPDNQLKSLMIRARQGDVPEIEKIIQRLDVPPPPVHNVDVTIYLMSALGQPAAGAVPPELEAVVKQLKSTFHYKGYQLIDTQVIRARAGQGGEASGVVEGASVNGNKTISQVKFRSASISTDEKGRAIRIDGFRVGLRVPVASAGPGVGQKQFQYLDTGIVTDVDIREGQKVVVGKANMDGSDRASIVVLMAKVVE